MRVFFDTELEDTGREIKLISLGAVREDGKQFYAEMAWKPSPSTDPWIVENVARHLRGPSVWLPRADLAREFNEFAGHDPEFWAYVGAYDWVALCQLYGKLLDRPGGWPSYYRDVKMLWEMAARPTPPRHFGTTHFALDDAMWTKELFDSLHRLNWFKMPPLMSEVA
ncbi:3'-5' exoribonuclease domain-containing protein [Methylocystis hirsuta]|nr:3'-5' exoribonuclease [Methylocystis hirsuta]